MTQQQALAYYFPVGTIQRKTVFLSDPQVEAIQRQAKVRVDSKVVTYYVGKTPAGMPAYAFFDTHIVRTMPETFMAVIRPDSTVGAVEVLAFYEPEDYLPPARWLSLLVDSRLTDELRLNRGVRNISGATLSAQAITNGVRRLLATFEVAIPKEK
jgi:hypothetical protein